MLDDLGVRTGIDLEGLLGGRALRRRAGRPPGAQPCGRRRPAHPAGRGAPDRALVRRLRPLLQPEHPDPRRHVPACGRQVGEVDEDAKPQKLSRFETEGAPWHFKVLIAITVIYLGYRLVQGIFWAAHSI